MSWNLIECQGRKARVPRVKQEPFSTHSGKKNHVGLIFACKVDSVAWSGQTLSTSREAKQLFVQGNMYIVIQIWHGGRVFRICWNCARRTPDCSKRLIIRVATHNWCKCSVAFVKFTMKKKMDQIKVPTLTCLQHGTRKWWFPSTESPFSFWAHFQVPC